MASNDDITEILLDRVELKIYAAEHHLNNVILLEDKYSNVPMPSIQLEVEVEIDCFLAEIIAAIDALLIQINNDLALGIANEKADLSTIQSALNSKTKNIDLLSELHKASERENWFRLLRELGNRTMYETILQIKHAKFTLNVGNYVDKDMIQYFQDTIWNVRSLVDSIRAKEPLLRRSA
jgi:hypothetical protein